MKMETNIYKKQKKPLISSSDTITQMFLTSTSGQLALFTLLSLQDDLIAKV